MYLGSTESIKSFLRYSDCMGIVSVFAVDRELRSGEFRVVDVDGLRFKRHFCFVSVQGQEADTALNFIQFVKDMVKNV